MPTLYPLLNLCYCIHMRKAVSIVTLTLLSLALSGSNSSASSVVNVVSEGEASAKVNISNNFNTSSTATGNSTSNTKIRIETDGEVKEYESNNGEDVNMESSDGTSKVTIKNSGGSNTSTSITPKPTTNDDNKTEKNIEEVLLQGPNELGEKGFFEKIKDFLKNLFF